MMYKAGKVGKLDAHNMRNRQRAFYDNSNIAQAVHPTITGSQMEDIVENSRGSLKPGKVAVAVLAALVMYAFATNCAFKYDIEKSYDKNEAQRTAENARHDKAITYLDGLYDKENTRHDKAITKLDDQADDVEERAKKMEERAKRVREAREAERAEEAAGQ